MDWDEELFWICAEIGNYFYVIWECYFMKYKVELLVENEKGKGG